ncbi:MAG: hypothetical protein HZA49_06915 [Planctomycetes bacterium]|nr:hypothetical protein [Planctomycetota bacterium]
MIPESDSSKHYPGHLIKTIAVISIAISLLLLSNSCLNRKKSGGGSGSSAPIPGTFQTTWPIDGSINIDVFSTSVPVAWNASSNATSYILEIAKEDDFSAANMVYSTTLGQNTTQQSVPFGLLWGGVWYYWRVKAVNAYGTTISSNDPSCFYTSAGGTAPNTFNLATPVNNDSGMSLTPEFNWTNAPKETKYTIYLDNDSGFASPLYTDTTRPGDLSIQIPTSAGLTETTRYYWKVDAYNPFGIRSSSTYSFVTGPIKSYTITPTATTITAGNGVTMTVTAYNSNNALVTSHNPFTLTMNSGTGLTYYSNNALTIANSTGTYTMTNGTATIYVRITLAGSMVLTATDRAGRTKASPTLTVNAGPVATVVVTGSSSINSGVQSSSYTAVSYDSNSNIIPDTYTWTKANGTGSANLSIDKLTGVLSGTVSITVTSNTAPTKSSGQSVIVLPGAISTVTVTGSDPITSGIQTSSYTAVSRDAAGNTLSDTYTWSNANGTGTATRSVDKLTGVLAGTVTITATSVAAPTKSGGKTVTVAPGAISTVSVSAPSGSISSGVEYTCTAASRDAAGNTVTDTFTWTKSNGTGSATLNVNRITGTLIGTVTITATSVAVPSKSGNSTLTVVPGSVATVTVTGSDPITSGIQTSSYTAVSRDAAGNTVSDTYNWSNANGTGTATRSVDRLTGVLSGTVTITATSVAAPTKSGGKTVTVIPGAINTVTVSGSDPITSGIQTSSYTAVSRDAATNQVADTFTWTNANGTGTATRSVDRLTGVLSGTVTITATSASSPTKSGGKTVLVIPGAINTVTVSGSDPITSGIQTSSYTATSTDAAGNLVSDTYTWSNANGSGTANRSVDKLTGVLSGTVTITATSVSAPTKSGGKTVTVIPGAVNSVTVSTPSGSIGSGVEYLCTATSKDAANNIVPDTHTWTKTNGTGTATLNVDKLTGLSIGTVTITATSVATPTKTANRTLTIVPGGISYYTVVPASSSVISWSTQSAVVTAKDISDNTVSTSTAVTITTAVVTATPTITFYTNNSYITTTGTYNLSGGVATIYYRARHDGTPPDGFTITAIDANSKQGTSTAITVNNLTGPANQLRWVTQPASPQTAGNTWSSFSIEVIDSFGNRCVTDSSTVMTMVTATGIGGFASGYTTTASSGLATFGALKYNTAETITIRGTSGGITSTAVSNSIVINPATASTLAFVQQPSTTTAGQTIAPIITVRSTDAYSNTVPSVSISLTITNGTAISGTLTRTSDGAGLASFNNLSMTLAGTYGLSASAIGCTTTASGNFTINPASANNIIFVQQPTDTTAGQSISPAMTIRVRDVYSNYVPSVSVSVTTTNGTLMSGSLAQTSDSSGLATFNNLSITLTGTYALSASAIGCTTTSSSNFTINPANASKLLWVTQPASPQIAGSSWASFSAEITDQYNNRVVTNASVTVVTVTGTTGFASGNTVAASGGVATFTATTYNRAETITIRATSGALTATSASNSVTVNPASPNKLAFVQQPTDTISGAAFAPAVTVIIRDQYDNNVITATNPVSLTVSAGSTLSGTTTNVPASGGLATFTGVTVYGIGANRTLTATSGTLISATSSPFSVTASGSSSTLTFIQQPTDTNAGNTISPAITILVRDQVGNPVSNTAVSITTTNGTTMAGTLTRNSDASGIATFNDLSISLAGTGYVLSATALSGTISATSNAFNIISVSTAPIVTTDPATVITVTWATLNGTVNPNGNNTDYYFEWGTTITYGNSTTIQNAGSGTSDVPVSVTLTSTSLAASTTYYFRLRATNSGGTTLGGNLTFTTYPDYRGSGADGPLTVTGTFNINTNWSGSRTQADAWNSRVSTMTANTATLVDAPSGAISPGDEVILISLKGSSTAFTNTGNYEFLRVASVAGNVVTFAWPKIRYYGDATGSDANCGSTQYVMLQRIPNYSGVAVPWDTNLTCSAWNGATGGVLAFRGLNTVSVGSTDTPATRTAYVSAYGVGLRGGTGVARSSNAPAGETYFGGLYSSGAQAGSFSSYNGVATPNPGGAGGGSSATDSSSSTVGSVGTTGPAGGGGGAAYSVSYFSLAGGGGGGGYGTVGQPGVGTISGTITATAGSGTTGGRGGDRLAGVPWTPEAGGGGGGGTYGDTTQLPYRAYLGAGGGAGGGSYGTGGEQTGGSGGTGGGFICIGANTVIVYYNQAGSTTDNAYIYAGGLAGVTPNTVARSCPGGGGGGSGGSIYIQASVITNQNIYGIATFGGTGGTSPYYSGGGGGAGRTYLQYDSFSGYSPAPSTGPTVNTNSAVTITYNSAVLSGTVNPNGADTNYYFEWGTTITYGNTTALQNAGNGTIDVSVSAPITSLVVSTTYYFRIVATNSSGTSYGSPLSFTTILPDYRGSGADGPITVTSGFNINTQTQQTTRTGTADAVIWTIDVNIPSGQSTISSTGARPTGFAVNDEVIIINLQGTASSYTNVGLYEFKRIIALPDNYSITLVSPLTNSYNGTTQRIIVQRVPNYTDVTISGSSSELFCNYWNGSTGGVMAFRANGTITINSTCYINASARGHRGGTGTTCNGSSEAGESYIQPRYASGGTATSSSATNAQSQNPGGGGGGGGYSTNGTISYTGNAAAGTIGPAGGGAGGLYDTSGNGFYFGGSGGGGGYGSVGLAYGVGSPGSSTIGGAGGQGSSDFGADAGGGGLYGDSTQLNRRAYLGAGGGAGGGVSDDYAEVISGTNAGTGGGFLFIGANVISNTGYIIANGGVGIDYYEATYATAGLGGGGAGGSAVLRVNTITNSGTISANGGRGGQDGWGDYGGAGGAGRLYYECNGYSGNTPQTRNGSAVEQSTYYYAGAPNE